MKKISLVCSIALCIFLTACQSSSSNSDLTRYSSTSESTETKTASSAAYETLQIGDETTIKEGISKGLKLSVVASEFRDVTEGGKPIKALIFQWVAENNTSEDILFDSFKVVDSKGNEEKLPSRVEGISSSTLDKLEPGKKIKLTSAYEVKSVDFPVKILYGGYLWQSNGAIPLSEQDFPSPVLLASSSNPSSTEIKSHNYVYEKLDLSKPSFSKKFEEGWSGYYKDGYVGYGVTKSTMEINVIEINLEIPFDESLEVDAEHLHDILYDHLPADAVKISDIKPDEFMFHSNETGKDYRIKYTRNSKGITSMYIYRTDV